LLSHPQEELAQFIVDLLTSKAEMLRQYFSLEIDVDDKSLRSLPLLLDGYTPAVEGLPMYILRLATEVDWDSEKDCFESFARETATFYAVSNEWLLETEEEKEEDVGTGNRKERLDSKETDRRMNPKKRKSCDDVQEGNNTDEIIMDEGFSTISNVSQKSSEEFNVEGQRLMKDIDIDSSQPSKMFSEVILW